VNKKDSRIRRRRKARANIKEKNVYRLSVNRTPRHIYAQIISPDGSSTVASASTVEKIVGEGLANSGNIEAAAVVGKLLAERAKTAGVANVAFDRSGFRYHGRVQALADAARENGLVF